MPLPEPVDLALQLAAAVILAGVVVAEDAGHRQGQVGKAGRDALLAIAEIAHNQQRIGSELGEQGHVTSVPLPVQIPGNGKTYVGRDDDSLP